MNKLTKKDLIESKIKEIKHCILLEKKSLNDKMIIKDFNITLKNLFNILYLENKLSEVV